MYVSMYADMLTPLCSV